MPLFDFSYAWLASNEQQIPTASGKARINSTHSALCEVTPSLYEVRRMGVSVVDTVVVFAVDVGAALRERFVELRNAARL